MMTPLDAAEHEMEERGFICDVADARAIITAFLEAAAEDEHLCLDVGAAAIDSHQNTDFLGDNGKAAILALKETING